MNAKRFLTIGGATAAVVILAWAIAVLFTTPPKSTAPVRQVMNAIKRFSTEQRPLPAMVTATELIAKGYLSSGTLKEFGATELTIRFPTNEPQKVLIEAVMLDGSVAGLLGDSSVQQLATP